MLQRRVLFLWYSEGEAILLGCRICRMLLSFCNLKASWNKVFVDRCLG